MRSLSAFVDTPRAAKRLVNVFRLVKVLIGPVAREEFVGSGYQTVLLELAIASGFPDLSREVFGYILRHPDGEFWDLIDDLRPRALSEGVGNAVTASLDGDQARRWRNMVEAVLSLKATFSVSTADAMKWAPLTQRFSFAGPVLGA